MSLSIPDLTLPLVGLSACLNKVSLSDNTDLSAIIPLDRAESTAEYQECYLHLVRERFNGDNGHFHLDLYSKAHVGEMKVDCSVKDIEDSFQSLVGKTLLLNFETRFLVSPTGPRPGGLLHLFGGIGINLNGVNASLSSATIQLRDTVYREIRWKQATTPASGGVRQFWIDLKGTLGLMPISDDLLNIVKDRALAGLNRLITPQPPATKTQND